MARLELTMTDEEKEALAQAARSEGLLTGPWVKMLALRRARTILSKAMEAKQ